MRMLTFLLLLFSTCFVHSSRIAEYDILISIKAAITSNDSSLSSWNTSSTEDFCVWSGVTCDGDYSYRHRHVTALNISGFNLTGTISSQIGVLRHLSKLDLSLNSFSGNIPPEITDCKFLTYVDLSSNNLSGEIPDEITGMKLLKYLNLSRNNLVGRIPASLSTMPSLTSVDLSFNKNLSRPPHKYSLLQFLLMDVGGVSGALLFSVLLFWVYDVTCRWKIIVFKNTGLTLADVSASLKKDNIIGEGDLGTVYKGTLPSGNCSFVVKRLPEVAQGWSNYRKFIAEIKTLGKIRYRHFVRLLAFYSNHVDNFLVYEYMPNGSLAEHLHGRRGGDCLPWSIRHEIAVAAAKGLCYLHHTCSPNIVHGNVKSSKVFLDTDFKAHLALPDNRLV